MKLKCTYNRDNDGVFTVGEIYEGEFNGMTSGEEWYLVKNNQVGVSSVCLNGRFWNFEIVEEENLLTGLQAIELMQHGKMVIETEQEGLEPFVFKIINNNVCFKHTDENEDDYQVDYAFDFTKTYKEYNEPKPLTGWERVRVGEEYISISSRQSLYFGELHDSQNQEQFDIANYFSTEEKAEEINFKQTLFRKLQRFSDENGGNEIDWNDEEQPKSFIFYNHYIQRLSVMTYGNRQDFGGVYFISEEVANKAIELFHDDLVKYFTM